LEREIAELGGRASAPVRSPTPSERNWGVACHLGVFAGLLVPFGHLLAPLVIWLVQREGSDFVADHGRESLNFQISISLYGIVAGLLTLVLIGYLLLGLLVIFDLVAVVVAAVRASNGERYRYPFTLRLIS
jgi:uncharacterized Tic20 family protein